MISYQTYFKNTSGFSGIIVPHLYEHAFLNAVTDAYPHSPYVSFSNATTLHRGGIFLSFICFNDQYEAELTHFVTENTAPTDDQIMQALRELQCEELGLYTVMSKTRLREQLGILATQPWQPVTTLPLVDATDDTMHVPRTLRYHADSQQFKRLTVSLVLSDQSAEDNAIFSYLSNGLLCEVLLHELRARFAARREGAQLATDNYHGNTLTQNSMYIVPRTTKKAEVETAVRETLQGLLEPRKFNYVLAYGRDYLTSADAGNLLVETYSQSGVLAGGETVSALLTPRRLRQIIESIVIKTGFRSI